MNHDNKKLFPRVTLTRPLVFLLFVGVGLMPLSGHTREPVQNGETLFGTCVACHGADAGGNAALGAPALAGQVEVYLQRQLHLFRLGIRGSEEGGSRGAQMQLFAKQIPDDAAVAELSAYLAALPPVPSTVPVQAAISGDVKRGASLYNGNCGACHGGQAEGNAALKAPRLQGLAPDYLIRQFSQFKSGVRGSNPEDRLGRQMAMMATTLPDAAALMDVLAYVASLADVSSPVKAAVAE